VQGTVECLIAMQEGVRANLAAEVNDRMEDLSTRATQEVLDDHLNLVEHWRAEGATERNTEEDIERLLEQDMRRNVSEDIVILKNRGTFRGYEGVRQMARMLVEELPEHNSFDYTYKVVEGRMGFLGWTYEDAKVRVKDGADSYLIEDGKIVAQTIDYTLEQK
jgi:ribosomal protein S13